MSEDTATDGAVLSEDTLRSIGKVAAELSAAYGVSYGDAIRRLTEVAALVAQARADGAAEERERIARAIEAAGNGVHFRTGTDDYGFKLYSCDDYARIARDPS